MDTNQKEMLERVFKNSWKFLWGLSPNKRLYKPNESYQWNVYRWLKNRGFSPSGGDQYAGSYGLVTNLLIRDHGIEKILELVASRVTEKFPEDQLDFFRNRWHTGELPDLSALVTYRSDDDWYPFLEIVKQGGYKYVERWGEMAGLWYECLEKWWNSTRTK